MWDSIAEVAGITVGHAQDEVGLTGCSVVLCEGGAVVGVDVRGPAPGTRETDLCRPGTLVERANAIVLAGGSAFGLDAASGVMRFLRKRGVGFPTGILPVPIVPGAVLFDLGIGEPVWPDAEMGYQACLAAGTDVAQGCMGAGTGATVGKALGPAGAMKSGIGTASSRVGEVTVGALIAVNAFGDVVRRGTGEIVAGARLPDGSFADTARVLMGDPSPGGAPGTNTTIGVIATDAALRPDQVRYLASIAHDGLARVIQPVHTMVDGDTIFALATGDGTGVGLDLVTRLVPAVAEVVERAVFNAVMYATPAGGLPAASG